MAARQSFYKVLLKVWRVQWAKSQCFQHASAIDPKLPMGTFLTMVKDVSRAQASILFQLRSRHAPLHNHLHRIGRVDWPLCPFCKSTEEMVHHFLFDCPAHSHTRFALSRALGLNFKSIYYVLGDTKALEPLLRYLKDMNRFQESVQSS